jgi:hypothetical protein
MMIPERGKGWNWRAHLRTSAERDLIARGDFLIAQINAMAVALEETNRTHIIDRAIERARAAKDRLP